MKVLVTGGVRSGKSWHAESLLAAAPSVSYVAPGPTAAEEPDPDWVARLAAHRRRRPGTWTTVETRDLASALRLGGPVLVDCLGTWLTSMIDSHVMWEATSDDVTGLVDRLLDGVVGALDERDDAILVTNEVGWGVVRPIGPVACSATSSVWSTGASPPPATRCTWSSPDRSSGSSCTSSRARVTDRSTAPPGSRRTRARCPLRRRLR